MTTSFMSSPMMRFTSESVTEGHPDKLCDQVSDAVLDALLAQDPGSRVACETATTTGTVWVFGEVTTKGYVEIEEIVRRTVKEIGYTDSAHGFDATQNATLAPIADALPRLEAAFARIVYLPFAGDYPATAFDRIVALVRAHASGGIPEHQHRDRRDL